MERKINSANLIAQIRQNLTSEKITYSALCSRINAERVKIGGERRMTKQNISRILSGKRKASFNIILEILYATHNPAANTGGYAEQIDDL